MRMGVGFVGNAVRGPARVADADRAVERTVGDAALEIDQLALGAAPVEVTVLDRGDAGRIVSAILKAFERIHDKRRHRRAAYDSNDSTHR